MKNIGMIGKPSRHLGRKTHIGVAGNRLVGRWRVREHHHVPIFRMFEEVIDAMLLHQTRNKRKIGFAILDAIFQFRKVPCRGRAMIDFPLLQNLLDHVQRRLLMPDPAIGRARQQPEGGPQY